VSDSEKFQIDFASALWGDASPAASRKARGGEVWIVEEAWRSERPALPLGPPPIPRHPPTYGIPEFLSPFCRCSTPSAKV
jgi:hypothetical protein